MRRIGEVGARVGARHRRVEAARPGATLPTARNLRPSLPTAPRWRSAAPASRPCSRTQAATARPAGRLGLGRDRPGACARPTASSAMPATRPASRSPTAASARLPRRGRGGLHRRRCTHRTRHRRRRAIGRCPATRPSRCPTATASRSARRARACRSYLAVRGGFAIAPVLGSRSTDTLAHVGPAPDRGRRRAARALGGARRHRRPARAAARSTCPRRQRDRHARRGDGPAHRLVHARGGGAAGEPGVEGHAAVQPRRPSPGRRTSRWSAPTRPNCRAKARSSAPSRCRPAGSRCCSWPTTRSRAATR